MFRTGLVVASGDEAPAAATQVANDVGRRVVHRVVVLVADEEVELLAPGVEPRRERKRGRNPPSMPAAMASEPTAPSGAVSAPVPAPRLARCRPRCGPESVRYP